MAVASNAGSQTGTNLSQAYLRTKVLTASPAELRLLLLEGAIRFAEQTKSGYAARDYERAFDGTTKCQAILTELLCSLRPEQSPDLCARLSSLYTYLYKRMVEASTNKRPEDVEEVLTLLRYERETWVLLMAELAKSGTDATAREDSTAPAPEQQAQVQPRFSTQA